MAKELLKGFDGPDLKRRLESVKTTHPDIHAKLRQVGKYLEALEREVKRLDDEVYGLRQMDLTKDFK